MPLTEEQEKHIREATPMDDVTIRLMLRKHKKLAELICQIILGEKSLRVLNIRTQYDASRGGIARGITMDAVIEANAQRVINLEIQIDARGRSPQRGRYHAGILDVEYLNSGEDFSELPETFVIFICDHDPFGKGERIYRVDRMIRTETGSQPVEYGDRQHILYVNGDWKGDDELGKLVHDFHCADADDMHFPLMAERLRYLKETEVGRMELSGLAKTFYDDGREDVQQEIAERMLRAKMEPAWIASMLNMSLQKVQEIENKLVSLQ